MNSEGTLDMQLHFKVHRGVTGFIGLFLFLVFSALLCHLNYLHTIKSSNSLFPLKVLMCIISSEEVGAPVVL